LAFPLEVVLEFGIRWNISVRIEVRDIGSVIHCWGLRVRDVFLEGRLRASGIGSHGVIDDKVDRHKRIDLLWVACRSRTSLGSGSGSGFSYTGMRR